jgi:tRNA dimethylallyltransferase
MAAESKLCLPIFLVGSTAVGKSEVALLLAEQLGGEIISVDSMQVYRGLDIGTAKPTSEERASVPHHLIDVAELNECFDAAKFVRLARQTVQEIQGRGRTPIFCGGTGLYLKAYLEGLGDAPSSNRDLRTELEKMPMEVLLRELKERDPVTYEKVDRQNPRRVIRALEVIRLTGRPFSEQRAKWDTSVPRVENLFGIQRAPGDLQRRIDARVEMMFRRGLIAETSSLLSRGLEQNLTAMQAIGYRQVAEHLRGERSLAETIELVKIRTRQFAKRQMTWFRRQFQLTWIAADNEDTNENIARKILGELARSQPSPSPSDSLR